MSQVAEETLALKSSTMPGSATAIIVELSGARIAPSATAASSLRSPLSFSLVCEVTGAISILVGQDSFCLA